MVNELWEGPRNILLAQIYRDLLKSAWPLPEGLKCMFPHLLDEEIKKYSSVITTIAKVHLLDFPNEENLQASRRWEALWEELFVRINNILKPFKDFPILIKSTRIKFVYKMESFP